MKALLYYYDQSGICGFNYDGADYYYRKNLQGDIVAILNASGNTVGKYKYNAWGECTVTIDINGIATLNPFRYRGYYFDGETQLYYLHNEYSGISGGRYYDHEVGRFLNPDTIEYLDPTTLNGLNLYQYALNNPVMNCDPSGHFVITATAAAWIIGGIIAVAVGTTTYVVLTTTPAGQQAMNNLGSAINDLGRDINRAIISISAGIVGWFSGSGADVGTITTGGTIAGTTTITGTYGPGVLEFSKSRGGGRESEWIGLADEVIEKMLEEARKAGDITRVMRLIKELKNRGLRNKKKNRGGPNMRGLGWGIIGLEMFRRLMRD